MGGLEWCLLLVGNQIIPPSTYCVWVWHVDLILLPKDSNKYQQQQIANKGLSLSVPKLPTQFPNLSCQHNIARKFKLPALGTFFFFSHISHVIQQSFSEIFCTLYALYSPIYSKLFSTAWIHSTAISSNIGKYYFCEQVLPEELWHPPPWWRASSSVRKSFVSCKVVALREGFILSALLEPPTPPCLTRQCFHTDSSQRQWAYRKGKSEQAQPKPD